MKAAIIAGCVVLSVLSASAAHGGEPNEHWRCGSYDIRIIPGESYISGEHTVLNNDEGFVVRKNGHDAGHSPIRTRMFNVTDGQCGRGDACPNGARSAYWSGITRGGKYNGFGELLTIDGVTHYTELLLSGKDETRVLRTEKHLCKRIKP